MRLAREYPELSESELSDLLVHITVKPKSGEKTYEYNCRSCDTTIRLTEELHNHYEMNRKTGVGFTMPKCSACWA